MWFPVFAWIVLLGASIYFARETLGLDPAHIAALFSTLSVPQRLAVGVIIVAGLSLIGAAVWQSYRLQRQARDLKLTRARLRGVRQETSTAQLAQKDFDGAIQNLRDSDPEQAIASLQQKLAETEQNAAFQQSRNEAVDMQDRLDEIRRRQQGVRETIGTVAERRRALEPVFTELRERQRQLERSLTEIEVDDQKNNLGDRLTELDRDVSQVRARVNALQESLATLNRFRGDMDKSQAELVPLRAPDAGIHTLIGELRLRHDALTKSLDELESSGDEKIGARVEALSKNKAEIEQRVARLDDSFNILDTIRLEFDELRERQLHLERSFAEVETDSSGKSLLERQNALNEFVIQTRLRLRTLQDSLITLKQFNEELAKSQTELAPLQAPVFGIEALIGEVHASRDHLLKTLGEIETNGDSPLGARVEALLQSKVETEERVASVFDHFTKLDSMRKDIGGIFAAIRSSLNRIS